jgi:hypothetical protein
MSTDLAEGEDEDENAEQGTGLWPSVYSDVLKKDM